MSEVNLDAALVERGGGMNNDENWRGVLRSKGCFRVAADHRVAYRGAQAGGVSDVKPAGMWWAAVPREHWGNGSCRARRSRWRDGLARKRLMKNDCNRVDFRAFAIGTTALAVLLHVGCAGSRKPATAHRSGGDGYDRRAMDHHFTSPEAFASKWDSPARDRWQKPGEIVASLGVRQGATVADLGAGTGYLIEFLRAAVGPDGRVLALDVEPAMIEFLQERKSNAGWDNVEVRRSAHDDPSLGSASVDAVVTLNTWHHVTGRTAFARRIHAGLTDGGRFVVVDFITEPTAGQGPPIEMRLAPEVVVAELEAAAFSAAVVEETLPRHYIVVATRGSRADPTSEP